MLKIGNVLEERLVKVTGIDPLTLPKGWLPKLTTVGLTETCVPVPVKPSTCGLPPSLLLTVTVPNLVPVAVGVNTAERVQLDPAPSVDPQVELEV